MDLTITNRAKDHFLEQLKSERGALFDQITQQSKRLGELETRLFVMLDFLRVSA